MTKIGSGTLTLSGVNTYTGVTTVSNGTLQLGNGTTDGSLTTSSIVNNATFAFNNVATKSYAIPISGTGAVTKSGAGA